MEEKKRLVQRGFCKALCTFDYSIVNSSVISQQVASKKVNVQNVDPQEIYDFLNMIKSIEEVFYTAFGNLPCITDTSRDLEDDDPAAFIRGDAQPSPMFPELVIVELHTDSE